jgi:uncharacterized repeat protein (TIGR03806 family)
MEVMSTPTPHADDARREASEPRVCAVARVGLVLALAAACAREPGEDATTGLDGSSSSGSSSASTGEPAWPSLPPRPATQSCRFDGQAPGLLPSLALSPIFAAEALADVVDVAPAGPDGRVFVAERDGRLLAGHVDQGELAPVVDLGDRGRVVALATAPDFPATGHLYVRYEASSGAPRAVIARFTVDPATGTADPASERIVMQIDGAVGPRSGGALVFDAAGMLLVGVGDLGDAFAARDPSTRAGKLLRVDPLPDGGYAIPADNPFLGGSGDADEVWALGLRDPGRCTLDADGALWCVDVGEVEHEVDRVLRGTDLGWPHVDGSTCLLPGGDCSDLDVEAPAATYRSDDRDCAASGALFGLSPELPAILVYADRCSGRVRGIDTQDPDFVVDEQLLAEEPEGVVALARDGRGLPIAVTGDARLARLVAAPPPGQFPQRLSDSGCFSDLAGLAPVPGVVPYGVNAELWSDGALKSRFIALPPATTIAVGDDGSLAFPTGTVLLKTFSFEFTAGDPASRRPVETRVMVKREHGWQFHSYRWRDDASDAELLEGGASATLVLAEQDATVELAYSWPSRGNCKVCHGFGASNALGPRIDQLNGDHDYGDASANQLLVLAGLGMFSPLPGAPDELPRIPAYSDPAADLEPRARAYLHTNCSHCHRPGGWTPPDLTMDLRWTTPLADTATCGVATQYANPWVDGLLRIAPGDPEVSAIWERIHQRGPGQMPPLGTTRIDPAATVVREWIARLNSCP